MTVEPVASAAAPAPPHALVTGGSRGLGRAIVVELAAAGYAVSFCYRSQSAAAATTLELARQRRPEAALWHAACDVADPDQVRDFVAAAIAEFGPAEVVVPAAGVNRDGPVALLAAADWTDVIDTDLSGVFHVVHEVVRPMMRLGRGRVITISSVAGCVGNAGQANY
ncbi:MAG: SDR family NAD(P)-dependent oxidoreductase, partial [Propionibacteriaceae bacterium]|nr:SDR family NAD(P)-dependent oxidoreductase [Propionibacteriaceae bacterium]